ncbi:protein RarD [Rhizorhabdus dicambivorans]|uniref:Protein RarD n=2 Tax=Rhizorhabdus dicambivorans TaxID=1850238 RepID=A0A2A4FY91_9SPHN|nr:protein RarD [Rhizorhabdus dicambivorans]PCE42690.1 protein RarD [Rhizorhabdus dicambivorans]
MGLGAYTLWGLLPLLIRLQRPLTAAGILAHRIVWSLLVLIALAFVLKRWPAVRAALARPRLALALCASTLVVGGNWLLYVHAVNSGQVMEASLGYYINPLVNVLLGVVVLRERLGRPEIVAVLLAAAGVTALAVHQGAIPYIPLGLAFSFGLYGLIRKLIGMGPVEGLLIETGLMAPVALLWLATQPILPPGVAGPPLWLLMLAGAVTIAPLLLFAGAANRIRYSELGLLQYIGPTIQMLLAVFLFGERLLPIHLITFGLIWSGLALYVAATWHRGRVTPTMPE